MESIGRDLTNKEVGWKLFFLNIALWTVHDSCQQIRTYTLWKKHIISQLLKHLQTRQVDGDWSPDKLYACLRFTNFVTIYKTNIMYVHLKQ